MRECRFCDKPSTHLLKCFWRSELVWRDVACKRCRGRAVTYDGSVLRSRELTKEEIGMLTPRPKRAKTEPDVRTPEAQGELW